MSQILKYIYNDNLIFGAEREIQGNLHEPKKMEIKLNQIQQIFFNGDEMKRSQIKVKSKTRWKCELITSKIGTSDFEKTSIGADCFDILLV